MTARGDVSDGLGKITPVFVSLERFRYLFSYVPLRISLVKYKYVMYVLLFEVFICYL